jgi:ABC-type dipeptide/oligopeptide/nickel transport system ATPase component
MLSIENLTVEYFRRGKVITAVRDFSLSISAGETIGLVGESGSGKSTVALAALKLIRPQEGRIVAGKVHFNQENLLVLSETELNRIRGKKISMIFQDPFTALNPVMRIREQLLEGGPIEEGRVLDALAQVQLEPQRVLQSYPHQLSGGQRQRVLIAMALLQKPDLVIADEPTTALDVLVQKDILDLLFKLQKDMGMGILFISHNLGLVATYTSKIVVMKEGSLIEMGTSRELFRHPAEPYTQALIASLPPMSRASRT